MQVKPKGILPLCLKIPKAPAIHSKFTRFDGLQGQISVQVEVEGNYIDMFKVGPKVHEVHSKVAQFDGLIIIIIIKDTWYSAQYKSL